MRVPCSREMSAAGCACAVGLLALTPCEYFQSTHFQLQWAPRLGARYALPAPCARCQLSHRSAEPAGVCRRAYSGMFAAWSARSARAPFGVQCVERRPGAGCCVPSGLCESCERASVSVSLRRCKPARGPTQLAAPLLSCDTLPAPSLRPRLRTRTCESLRHAKAHCRWRRRRPVARMAPKARAPRFGSVACASRAERLHFVRRKQARRLRQGPGRLCRLLTCCKTYARASS